MTLTTVETYRLDPLCLVRVIDADGVDGWGQTAPFLPHLTEQVLHELAAPCVLGREGDDIEAIVRAILERHYKFTGTFLYRAVGGIDTALWDLRAKRAGLSVCELLGGRPRPVAVYGSSMRRDTSPEQEAERMAALHERNGFGAFKIRIGPRLGMDGDPAGAEARTRALVPRVRAALPKSVKLFADANGSYDARRAVEVGRWLADEGVSCFEEPCPHTDPHATAEVRRQLEGVIDIAGGEQDYLPAVWRLMLDLHAVDILQPDVMYNGGVCLTRELARLAEQRGRQVMPHSANRSLLQIFTLHLMASLPNAAPWMEYSIETTPWTDDLFTPPPQITAGEMRFPDGPGWGVRLNRDRLAQAQCRISRPD